MGFIKIARLNRLDPKADTSEDIFVLLFFNQTLLVFRFNANLHGMRLVGMEAFVLLCQASYNKTSDQIPLLN